MRYTDYIRLKTGRYQSVGKFGDNIYAYEVLTGVTDSPEYHQISMAEFDSFETWSQEYISDLKKCMKSLTAPLSAAATWGERSLILHCFVIFSCKLYLLLRLRNDSPIRGQEHSLTGIRAGRGFLLEQVLVFCSGQELVIADSMFF